MRFACSVRQLSNTQWMAHHNGPEVGEVEVRGASKDEVIEKMRGELRYRLELCPCTGESYQHIDIDIAEEFSPRKPR